MNCCRDWFGSLSHAAKANDSRCSVSRKCKHNALYNVSLRSVFICAQSERPTAYSLFLFTVPSVAQRTLSQNTEITNFNIIIFHQKICSGQYDCKIFDHVQSNPDINFITIFYFALHWDKNGSAKQHIYNNTHNGYNLMTICPTQCYSECNYFLDDSTDALVYTSGASEIEQSN